MRRALVALCVVLAAVPASAASPSTGSATVNALVYQGRTVSVATLEATTFRPRGRLLPLGRGQGSV